MWNDDRHSNQPADFELSSMIRAELQPNERIVWSGGPNPRRMARKTWPLVAFGIPWTAFAMFSMVWMVFLSPAPSEKAMMGLGFALVVGLPFLLIGLVMLTAPRAAAKRAAKTAHVITNQRVIFFESERRGRTKVRSLLPRQLTDIRRTQLADGSGDLTFGRVEQIVSQWGFRYTGDINSNSFVGIPDVKTVESLVLALANSEGERL